MERLGQWMREQRTAAGMSQPALGAAVARVQGDPRSRSQALVSQWESGGRAITLSDFLAFCNVLDIPPDEWSIAAQSAHAQHSTSLAA